MEFLDVFDELLAKEGPPAIFTLNYEGCLQFDLLKSRDLLRQNPNPRVRAWCHCVLTDNDTNWPQYVLITSPDLCKLHSRAKIEIFNSYSEAIAYVTKAKELLYKKNSSC